MGGLDLTHTIIGPPLVPQLVFAVGYVGGYLLWSRVYYRKVAMATLARW
jgi:hypothetical protein